MWAHVHRAVNHALIIWLDEWHLVIAGLKGFLGGWCKRTTNLTSSKHDLFWLLVSELLERDSIRFVVFFRMLPKDWRGKRILSFFFFIICGCIFHSTMHGRLWPRKQQAWLIYILDPLRERKKKTGFKSAIWTDREQTINTGWPFWSIRRLVISFPYFRCPRLGSPCPRRDFKVVLM